MYQARITDNRDLNVAGRSGIHRVIHDTGSVQRKALNHSTEKLGDGSADASLVRDGVISALGLFAGVLVVEAGIVVRVVLYNVVMRIAASRDVPAGTMPWIFAAIQLSTYALWLSRVATSLALNVKRTPPPT